MKNELGNQYLSPIDMFEAVQLGQGILPDRIESGAWRPLTPGETVNRAFIHNLEGTDFVPVRLYGFCPIGATCEIVQEDAYEDFSVVLEPGNAIYVLSDLASS